MSRASTYHASTSTSNTLQTRIAQKQSELASLTTLRDLSSRLATQMQALELKLSTLRDGTEAVACVLENWDGVLGVIGLVGRSVGEGGLPETLVRIPVTGADKEGEGVK